jgi:hypothetical protein
VPVMTPKTPRRTLLVALAAAATAAVGAGPAAAQGTPVLSGGLAAGGSWNLSIYHQDIGAIKGVCIDLGATLADGTDQGTATGCAAGDLRVDHGILPLSSIARTGETQTSSVTAGIVTSKAHDVRLTFADGKHLKILTKPGPKAWRRVLKMNVRYFGADTLPTTTAAVKSVSAYDRHGHRITRTTKLK